MYTCTVAYTGQVTIYQKITVMFNWSPCIKTILHEFDWTPVSRYAPCNPVLLEGEALATAAANRSAAFYQTKQYKEAIEDVGELLVDDM